MNNKDFLNRERQIGECKKVFSSIVQESQIVSHAFFPTVITQDKILELFEKLGDAKSVAEYNEIESALIDKLSKMREALNKPIDSKSIRSVMQGNYLDNPLYKSLNSSKNQYDALRSILNHYQKYVRTSLVKNTVNNKEKEEKKQPTRPRSQKPNKVDYYEYVPSKDGKLTELCIQICDEILESYSMSFMGMIRGAKKEFKNDFSTFINTDIRMNDEDRSFDIYEQLRELNELSDNDLSELFNYSEELLSEITSAKYMPANMKKELLSLSEKYSNSALQSLINIIIKYRNELKKDVKINDEPEKSEDIIEEVVKAEMSESVEQEIVEKVEQKKETLEEKVESNEDLEEENIEITEEVEKEIEQQLNQEEKNQEQLIEYLLSVAMIEKNKMLEQYSFTSINTNLMSDVNNLEQKLAELDQRISDLWNMSVHMDNGMEDNSKELGILVSERKKIKNQLSKEKSNYDLYNSIFGQSIMDDYSEQIVMINMYFDDIMRDIRNGIIQTEGELLESVENVKTNIEYSKAR